jgi:glycosyltransferase involved in cell wall biosynthesis
MQLPRNEPGAKIVNVLALIAATEVSGPCSGLFQLVEQSKDREARFVLGMFLLESYATCAAIEEAQRRGFQTAILSQRRRYDPGLISQAWRVIKKHRVELLQSHGYKPALLAWCLKWFVRIPWVAFAHGYTSENRRMALYNRLDAWLLRHADRVVVVSEATGRLIESAGVPRQIIRVIPNAIDSSDEVKADGTNFRRHCGAGSDDLLIGVIGRLSPEKGQAVFLQALTEVLKFVGKARAVFVGDGQDMAGLKEQTRLRGLEDRVTFMGHQTDMPPIYAGLDLVVIPSLSEGLPNVLLEAMVYRKPVVATNVGGIPEVMQDGLSKFLVSPGDAQAMANTILEVLRDPTLRRELGEAGQRRVREAFSPSQRAAQVMELYKELLEV